MSRSRFAKLAVPLTFVAFAGCTASNGGSSETDDGFVSPADQGQPASDPGGPPGSDGIVTGGDHAGFGDVDDGDSAPRVYGLDARPPVTTCLPFTPAPLTSDIQFVNRFPSIHFPVIGSDGSAGVPVSMNQRPGDNSRFYVNQRNGRIYSFPNDPTATEDQVQLALDLSDVLFEGWDCSAASLVFPPDFETTHAAYVDYCYQFTNPSNPNPHSQIRLSRFYTNDGGLTFDRSSEQVLMAINYHETADPDGCGHSPGDDGLHAGDAAHFGSDGYLYMSVGDGGPQGVCGGKEAQSLSQLRGKLLRMDVSDFVGQVPDEHLGFEEGMMYTNGVVAPVDNPFYGPDPNPSFMVSPTVTQPFIWAYGFRNPWQWSFDPQDGTIWLGDVGNNTYEEVDRAVQKGGNYGWGYWEGYHSTNGWSAPDLAAHAQCTAGYTAAACNAAVSNGDLVSTYTFPPLLEYTHGSNADQGNAISGGRVYRGTGVPAYTGSYFFGDSQHSQHVWVVPNIDALSQTGADCSVNACATGLVCMDRGTAFNPGDNAAGKEPRCEAVKTTVATTGAVIPSSFSTDQNGELYLVNLAGTILQLQGVPDTGGTGGPPALLSQTGCFQTTTDGGGTVTGIADGAPPVSDLIPFAPAAELWSDGATKRRWMEVQGDSVITLAADGDFEFPVGTMLVKEFSLAGQRVETRFLVRQVADGHWAGYSYEWNANGTDATLVSENGASQAWGAQTWFYPSRSQCFQCHNTVANTALGPELAQLNNTIHYDASDRDANQMDTLTNIGLVDASTYAPPYPALAPIGDTTRSTDERARSYLHVNCSICHRPNGPTFTPPDMRYEVPFADMRLCNQDPTISDLEELITPQPPRPHLLTPDTPDYSEVYVRMQTTDTRFRMPPLARTITHDAAVEVIGDWINGISSCPGQ